MAKPPKVEWDAQASPQENARSRLPALLADYFTAGRSLLAGNPPPPEFHAFRLRTKHLRYTLELFRPCYGAALEKRMGYLRTVQQLLGDINDCVASKRVVPTLHAFLDKLTIQRINAFLKYWQEKFDTPGAQRGWETYLRKPLTSSSRRPPRPRRASGQSR